ncbi:MAG: twin-arginine translocation signal domain-containing protein [Thermomicrobiales bacterium]
MSPSRRDVLKSLAIATAAVVLPKQALATPDTFASDATIDDAIYDHLTSFEVLSDRIAAEHDEIQARLVTHANHAGIWLESSGGEYIARQPDRPGECELVTWNKCTCHRYSVWHRCEHVALVRSLVA